MSERTILVWFRNDLRIRDNEILTEAIKKGGKVLPVYCFDLRYFQRSDSGHRKTGAFRLRFLLESVAALRESLREIGGDLIIRIGSPEEILPDLCQMYQVSEVYHHREIAPTETQISANVEAALWKYRINLKHFIGHTLYHKEDLPFPIKNIPNQFHVFRKKLEKDSHIRPCLPAPIKVHLPEDIEVGMLPDFKTFGFTAEERKRAYVSNGFIGGELSALNWVHALLDEGDITDKTQLQFFTSKLSPWLSFGCISSREIYSIVKAFAKLMPVISAGIITELLWRDYFRFMIKKYGEVLPESAIDHEDIRFSDYKFKKWKNGRTGNVWVDACMNQLKNTGYISESCRIFAGDYLVAKLGGDWRRASEYYQEMLVDFAPATNEGHWAFIIGDSIIEQQKLLFPTAEMISKNEDLRKWITPDANSPQPQPV